MALAFAWWMRLTAARENFAFAGGVKGFVEFINQNKTPVHLGILSSSDSDAGGVNVTVDVAMQWNDSLLIKQTLCLSSTFPNATVVLT